MQPALATAPSAGIPPAGLGREDDEGFDSATCFIDFEHDGPWMSVMSLDGHTVYINRNLPREVMIDGKLAVVGEICAAHESAEWIDLESLMEEFKLKNEREPNAAEREKLYQRAHKRTGVPAEREYCRRVGVPWGPWNAWCRGEESKLEKGPFENEPEDADVKPIPHKHGELEATDSALRLAFDRESVRMMDGDGRMKVTLANISKANICPYKGSEIPDWEELGLEPDRVYRLLRDPEELAKAAATFNGIQILRKHTPVSAEDHQPDEVVGSTGTDAKFTDPYLQNSLNIWSQEAIDDIESGRKKELSCGYHYKPDMTPGNFDGSPYDGIMRDIVGNHVALVEDGRAGPDVIVGDSIEGIMDNRELAKKLNAFAVRGASILALTTALKPKLAQDAKIDFGTVFDGIKCGPDFKNQKSKIAIRLRSQAKDKLAKDATLDDVEKVIEMLEKHEVAGGDESVSKEQHNAMAAAAHGHSNLGIPQNVGEEFTKADTGKSFDEAMPEWLKGKGMSEDDINELKGMDWFPKPATDEELKSPSVTPGEEVTLHNREKEKGGESLEPKNPTGDRKMAGDSVTRQAMDSAIQKATTDAEKRIRLSQQEVRIALEEVRPWVGQLPVTLAFDSGEQVRRHALQMLGHERAKTAHADALPDILAAIPKPGAPTHDTVTGESLIAMDKAVSDDLDKMLGLGRIKHV